jgi:uncharacterized phiE125 gp8 family phage protein
MTRYNHPPSLMRTVAPASEPLTLAETKIYLKIDNTSDDTLITSLIETVRIAAEGFLHSALITQSWKMSYDKYAPSIVPLPMGPVQSITSVTSVARDGSSSVVDNGTYYLSGGNRNLIFDASPLSHRVEVIYVAGYGASASDVPSPIRYGMLAHLAAIFDGRAGQHSLPKQAMDFYMPYKVVRV